MTEDSRTSAAERVEIQRACRRDNAPTDQQFLHWLAPVLALAPPDASLCVRLVDAEESRTLNRQYRDRDAATNVLSFPFEAPPGLEMLPLLGDLVICVDVVRDEARAQGKSAEAHWAHMLTHGVLHLLGHDHQEDDEAERMEQLERKLLEQLGFADPYVERIEAGPA